MKKIAFGTAELKPDEFWRLTLAEVTDVIEAVSEGKIQRMETDYHRTAWLAMHVMNTQGTLKHPVSVDKLLGKKQQASTRMTLEERDNAITDLLSKFDMAGGDE